MKVTKKNPPPIVLGRPRTYHFETLQAGTAAEIGDYSKSLQSNVYMSAKKWAEKEQNGAYFTTRNENGKLILYRIK